MFEMLVVGFGGFFGAVSRYKLSAWVLHHYGASGFPWGTFAVNMLGCLLIGLIAALAERYHLISPSMRLLLITGVLGSFTTFSAFGFETLFLLRRGELVLASANVLLSLSCGLFAVWLGSRV